MNGSVNCRVVMGPGRGAGASAAKRVGIEAKSWLGSARSGVLIVTPDGVSCDPKACSELHWGVFDSTSGVFPKEDEAGGGVAVVPGLADSSLIPALPAGPGERTGEEQSPV